MKLEIRAELWRLLYGVQWQRIEGLSLNPEYEHGQLNPDVTAEHQKLILIDENP